MLSSTLCLVLCAFLAQVFVSQAQVACVSANENQDLILSCSTAGYTITQVSFASYGTPTGCPSPAINTQCHASGTLARVNSQCLNRASCSLNVNNVDYGGDPCSGTGKSLRVVYTCAASSGSVPATTGTNSNGLYTCSYTSSAGYRYDLSSLQRNDADYVLHDAANNYDYYVNLCRGLVNPSVCGANAGAVAMCQTGDFGSAVLARGGESFSDIGTPGTGVILRLQNGADGRNVSITFVCDASIPVGSPTYINEAPILQYNFQWRTAVACATETPCSDIIRDVDIVGSDSPNSPYRFPGGTYSQCCAACRADEGTNAFVYITDSGDCWCKYVDPTLQPSPSSVRYFGRLGGVCSKRVGYDVPGTNSAMSPYIGVPSADDCCRQCRSVVGTNAYVWQPSTRNCWCKTTNPSDLSTAANDRVVGRYAMIQSNFQTCVEAGEYQNLQLTCANGRIISQINFASYGTPTSCPNPTINTQCHAAGSVAAVQSACLGRTTCTMAVGNAVVGGDSADPCWGTTKRLHVIYTCADANQATGVVPVPMTTRSAITGGSGQAYDCHYTSSAGYSYDLSGLQNNTGDYILYDRADGRSFDYHFNLCRNLVNSAPCGGGDMTVCQAEPQISVYHVVARSPASFSDIGAPGTGVVLRIAGGDGGRVAQLTFVCDNIVPVGLPSYVNEAPVLQYNFQWRTAQACATDTPCLGVQDGYDIAGSDSPRSPHNLGTSGTYSACCATCRNDVGTNAFVYQPSTGNCWCKYLDPTLPAYTAVDRVFGRYGGVCTSRPGYDIGGSDVGSSFSGMSSPEACCRQCRSIVGTNAYVLQPSTGTCWCKSVNPDAVSYSANDRTVGRYARITANFSTCVEAGENNMLRLQCADGRQISEITFASYGTPVDCPNPAINRNCHAANSVQVVTRACVGRTVCNITVNNDFFGGASADPCHSVLKRLAVTYTCANNVPLPATTGSGQSSGGSQTGLYECRYTSSAGFSYDLRPLQNDENDYLLIDQSTNPSEPWVNFYYVNLCRELVNPTVCGSADQVALCQTGDFGSAVLARGGASFADIGVPGTGVVLKLQLGDMGRNASITFVCDSTIPIGLPTFINESPILQYNFEWRTAVACATGTSCSDIHTESDIVGSDSPSSPHILPVGASYAQCCAACQADYGTNAFVYRPSDRNCWCKYLDPTQQPHYQNDRFFGRHGGVCSERAGYDIGGSNSPFSPYLGVASAPECCRQCRSVSGTNAYVWQPSTRTCWCKTVDPAALSYEAADRTVGRYAMIDNSVGTCVEAGENTALVMNCANGRHIENIDFASYGTPTSCPNPTINNQCHAATSLTAVTAACRGRQSCSITVNNDFAGDPCPNVLKRLAVKYRCADGAGTIGTTGTGSMTSGAQGYYDCHYTSSFGYSYDLSRLQNDDTDYVLRDVVNNYNFYVNLCRSMVNSSYCGGGDMAMCQTGSFGSAILARNSASFSDTDSPGTGLVLRLQNGQDGRNVSVKFICDSTVPMGLPDYINESPILQYNFQWRTSAACATGTPCRDIQDGYDIVGSDSPSSPHMLGSSGTYSRCCAACQADAGTNVFVYRPSDGYCWCKYLDPTQQPSVAQDRVFGRHGGLCTTRPGYDIVGTNSALSPYRNMEDAPACCAQCRSISGTNAYVWQPSTRNCWCKTVDPAATSTAANDRTVGRYAMINNTIGTCVEASENQNLNLQCANGRYIQEITFGSYGTPSGCPNPAINPLCHADNSLTAIREACVGRQSCSIFVNNDFIGDPCYEVLKHMTVVYRCADGMGVPMTTGAPPPPNGDLYDCRYISSRGYSYDLSRLRRDDSDYMMRDTVLQYDYYVNLCRNMVNTSRCGGGEMGMCQVGNVDHYVIGRRPVRFSDIGSAGTGVVMTLLGGDDGRQTQITFRCDNSIATGLPSYINEAPMLQYNFEWRTSAACATGTPCRDVQDGYDITGSDSPSSPYLLGSSGTYSQCCARCQADEGTNVFVYRPSDGFCWCKYLDPTQRPTPAADRVFGRHGGLCTKRVGYTIEGANSALSPYMGVVDAPACCSQCRSVTGTNAYVWQSSTRNCWCKTVDPAQLSIAQVDRTVGRYAMITPDYATCLEGGENQQMTLQCANNRHITSIDFASYGTPSPCPSPVAQGTCDAAQAKQIIESQCLKQQRCTLTVDNNIAGDPCPNVLKHLTVVYRCADNNGQSSPPMYRASFMIRLNATFLGFDSINFLSKLATFIGFPRGNIEVLMIKPGSVVIDFALVHIESEVRRAERVLNDAWSRGSMSTNLTLVVLNFKVTQTASPSGAIDPEVGNKPSGPRLSGGAIAGIIIGVVVLVAIVIVLAFFIVSSKNKKYVLKEVDSESANRRADAGMTPTNSVGLFDMNATARQNSGGAVELDNEFRDLRQQ